MIPISLIFLSSIGIGNAQTRNGNDIVGTKWTNAVKSAQIQFQEKDGKFFATLHLLKNTDAIDINNPNKSLRSRKLEGITIISNLAYSNGQYTGGTIYAPERGQTVSCKVEWIDNNTISVTGSKGFISKSQLWKR